MQKQLNLLLKVSFLAVLFSAPQFYAVKPAEAKLKICNETGKIRDVAIGYKTSEGWISEGWWGILNGDCTTVIKEDLTSRYYYYRAKHKGSDFDGDSYNFCTEAKAFTITGDKDCKKRGFEIEDFRQLELLKGTTGFTLTLDETTIYSVDKKVAGNTDQKVAPEQEPKASPAAAAQSAGPDAASGTHGEPYSVRATLYGCGRVDGLIWCTFLAEDWKYVVKDDGKSHSYILEEIDALPVGGTYDLSGDMIFYSGDTAEITVREYSSMQSNSTNVAPGTYGEPYSVTAIFKGCEQDAGQILCEFLTDGWRYIAMNDGKTDDGILNQLIKLPTDKSFQIEGDITNYGDITAEVTIRKFEEIAQTGAQALLNPLVGLWRSRSDKNSTMRVTSESVKYDYYEGDLMGEGDVSFTKQCDDLQVLQTDTTLMQINDRKSAEDIYCYEILDVTENGLSLMYLPRGNILEYKKDLGLN